MYCWFEQEEQAHKPQIDLEKDFTNEAVTTPIQLDAIVSFCFNQN